MTSSSTQLIADVLRHPCPADSLHWVLPEVPFRTAQDYAATDYLFRLRLCSLQVRCSRLWSALSIKAAREGRRGFAPARVSTSAVLLQYPVQVTAQLLYMKEPLSPIVESSAVYAASPTSLHTSSNPTSTEHLVEFFFVEEWLIFPLELCDIPLDATCEVCLWYNDCHVGRANFYIYSVEGELRVGQQHLTLSPTSASATAAASAAERTTTGAIDGTSVEETAVLLPEYHRGRLPVIPWLDALSVHQLEARQASQARVEILSGSKAEGAALLTVYLPTATTAVFFEPAVASVSREMKALLNLNADEASTGDYTQRLFPDQYTFFKDYNLSEAKAAITSKSQYFVSECSAPPGPKERHQLATLLRRPPIQLDHGAGSGTGGGVVGVGVGGSVGGVGAVNRLEETRLLWKYRHTICKDGRFLLPFMRSVDWSNTHSTERRAACTLMQQWARPGLADVLACLSFYFDHVAPVRQYAVRLLRQESDARLCQVAFQLLQAVRYDSTEGELATFLLDRACGCWEICSTLYTMLTVEVALERRRAGGAAKATESITAASGCPSPPPQSPRASSRENPSLRFPPPDSVFESLLRSLAGRLTQQNTHFISRLRQQHAMHRVLQQLGKQIQQSALDRLGKASLGNKLITKHSCGLHTLFGTLRHRAPYKASATNLEQHNNTTATSNRGFVTGVANTPQERSSDNSTLRAQWEGEEGNKRENEGNTAANSEDMHEDNSTAPLQRSHTRLGMQPPPARESPHRKRTATTVDVLDRYGVVTLPIYPAVPIAGILPNSLYVFKSAKMPMRLTFKAVRSVSTQDAETAGATATSSTTACLTPLAMQRHQGSLTSQRTNADTNSRNGGEVSSVFAEDPIGSAEEDTVPLAIMYKYDDDVRQDQLIVQLIRVMDDLFQQDGLQLYLTPYRVLATGPHEGLVEVVPKGTTFLSVQREVLKYLRVYNPTAELLRQAMDRYTRSFAGYCVITFVLGIGDRHLENILLTQDGRLLHIDFGYVFGNDPKPFPPPMKINREMVEVLGGPQSTGFMEFKLYCCSAYNILRKHASLLLHMLLLVAHAESMPQVTGDGAEPRANLVKVQEKLRLDLTNAQATQYLQNVIADSVGSIFTNLWDVIHAAAQATRS